ncbi:peptidase M61, partial [bacterium]
MLRGRVAFVLLALILSLPAARAAEPADRAPRGAIALRVDLSDVGHRVFRVEQTIPVRPGTVTLHYPQWTPGNHAPRGPIEQLGGLTFRAGGRTLAWQRDPYDVYTFRVTVPAGVDALDVAFQVATPQTSDGGQGRVVVTSNLLGLQWNQVVLYPDGLYTRRIPVVAQ